MIACFVFMHQTWSSVICMYAPVTKQQSSQWKIPSSTCLKMVKRGRSNFESMFIVFFDSEQMLHAEFILLCQNVNRQFYIGFLRHWRRMLGEESQTSGTLRTGQDRLLRHDTVLAHTLSSVQWFWTNNNMAVVSHPSACLTYPCTFFIFPKMEIQSKGQRFEDTLEIHGE